MLNVYKYCTISYLKDQHQSNWYLIGNENKKEKGE